ncbi:MAG: isoprenylcysteine carboxylmethyltransferase family protein [Myxococcota bacterium]
MRNPIRLKNLKMRFLPIYLIGVGVLFFRPTASEYFLIALFLIGFGAALRGWGAGHLVKNAELTTTGPYAYLRHPLYLGTIMAATGFAIWAGGGLTLLVLAFLWPWFGLHYFPRKERVESARLEAAFGEEFRCYRRSVPALWPQLRRFHGDRGTGPSDRWRLDRYSENNELGTLLALSLGVLLFWLTDSMVAR